MNLPHRPTKSYNSAEMVYVFYNVYNYVCLSVPVTHTISVVLLLFVSFFFGGGEVADSCHHTVRPVNQHLALRLQTVLALALPLQLPRSALRTHNTFCQVSMLYMHLHVGGPND